MCYLAVYKWVKMRPLTLQQQSDEHQKDFLILNPVI